MMLKLFVSNLKMLARNKQSLFWSLFFPLIFTVIFGLFFGRENNMSGTIAVVNESQTQIATGLDKALTDSKLFNISSEKNFDAAKTLVEKSKISAVVEIPGTFGSLAPTDSKEVKVFYDPGSAQTVQILNNFIGGYLTQASFQIQKSQPLFSVKSEKTGNTTRSYSYFDFVMAGILGLALMNSSIIGIAIAISSYREDKILKRITTTPLPTWKFISMEVLSRLVVNLVQIGLILAVGVYGFHGHVYGNLFVLLGIALIGAILFQLLGFVIATFAKNPDAAQSMSQVIAIPMMFLAGVFFPIDSLPSWLSSIVQYLPLAPLLRMLRAVSTEAQSPFTNPINIAIVAGWIVLTLSFTIWRFRLSDE
ncbi:MAG TPA: ABC transporter permease [Candidatus Saccharimonadales bacterium]|nr:ABC transporter permease [Candidatus Saccharimonadales bacterium]